MPKVLYSQFFKAIGIRFKSVARYDAAAAIIAKKHGLDLARERYGRRLWPAFLAIFAVSAYSLWPSVDRYDRIACFSWINAGRLAQPAYLRRRRDPCRIALRLAGGQNFGDIVARVFFAAAYCTLRRCRCGLAYSRSPREGPMAAKKYYYLRYRDACSCRLGGGERLCFTVSRSSLYFPTPMPILPCRSSGSLSSPLKTSATNPGLKKY